MRYLTQVPIVGRLALICSCFCASQLQAGDISFNRDIRPILSRNCFACHGPDDNARQANLRLDTAKGLFDSQTESNVIVPGHSDSSVLIQRIESDNPETAMPPPDSGYQLTDQHKRILRDWITSGADYETHWSFVEPKKAEVPGVIASHWPTHPIDNFILAGMEQNGLAPAAEANRFNWIRRVSLDLTGLPPTPEDADVFRNDKSEKAFEAVVDRLLNTPAFGEHWARMWLDLARYADTKGYEKDKPREIWRYRDWVIDAFNRDMPFDQFTTEQLAGDMLPNASPDQLLATAFHRNTLTNEEGGTDDEEFRIAAVKDRVDTTMQVWMGLTMGCAKCHSHKFDPISQRDYYSFFAVFNQTEDSDRGNDAPVLQTPSVHQSKRIADIKMAIGKLELSIKEPTEGKVAAINLQLEKAKKSLTDAIAVVAKTPVMKELPPGKRRGSHIHIRGNFLEKGEAVQPAVPTLFGDLPRDSTANRLSVAKWIAHPRNPLTARVMVNRVWARLFGKGIVETEEDFGSQGADPSHPALLDWLAVDFREQGWSLKQLLRSIVLSATYRQSSSVSREKLDVDPQNRLLCRGPRFRLSAEMIRDQALKASGLLSGRIGGPSVMPPQPAGVWKSTYSALQWADATDANRYRRALYTYWKRTSPYPSMMTFDAGSGEVCQIRRIRTNTPLQALVTLNDPAYFEAAGALSERMLEIEGSLTDNIHRGFRLVLTRPPTTTEARRLITLYKTLDADFQAQESSAQQLLSAAGLASGDAAMVAVANVLLNLDETLMKP